jgi:hypothetical protein
MNFFQKTFFLLRRFFYICIVTLKPNKMKDSISIEIVPLDEPCAQLKDPGYAERSVMEYKAMYNQLLRMFGPPRGNAYLKKVSNSHDFGSYITLDIIFDEDNEEESAWAYHIDNNLPERWDKEAIRELCLLGYFN